ncbi:MAG: hypothetical protein WD079_02580, partial [Phycisphaeraceae bacterium]
KRIDEQTTRLAGAELGGIPLVAAASLATGLPCLFIRNQKKDYGTSQQLEGKLESNDRVVLLEDVCTTGGQILEAAKVIEATGASVTQIIGTIDREEGARENIEAAGYTFQALFTKTDLGVYPPPPCPAWCLGVQRYPRAGSSPTRPPHLVPHVVWAINASSNASDPPAPHFTP